ncbi:telomerase protein component 1 isoform X2 [Amia ocellicauda]|uniref:telomerase protein component 1 isoform X2 n=1 Tax=Amia ocellicauda TaxID=2972642 RepID=UPI003463D0FA
MKTPQAAQDPDPERALSSFPVSSRLAPSARGISLENRILAEASSALSYRGSSGVAPALDESGRLCGLSALKSAAGALTSTCAALRPTHLSSTSSTQLSSPFLGTQNTLLSQWTKALHRPAATLTPSSLLRPSNLTSTRGSGDKQEGSGGRGGGNEIEKGRKRFSETPLESYQSLSEQWSQVSDRGSGSLADEDLDEEVSDEMPVPDLESTGEEEEEEMEVEEVVFEKTDGFGEILESSEKREAELKDKKFLLLNMVCCSVVNKCTAPGQKDWDTEKGIWAKLRALAEDISRQDAEFLLKVAVYTRQELNIRITANFLLALSARLPEAKPHLRRYYCAAIQLPSDWIEVVRLYSTCFGGNLPSCLKKAMADKFKQFSEYQLAKYNTSKQRCKHSRPKPKGDQDMERWASLLKMQQDFLQKYENSSTNNQQNIFSLKKLVQKLHIKEPAEHVMGILGRKYPSDQHSFSRSGLPGAWVPQRAGQRMKLTVPQTWEKMLSLKGNKAQTWEQLIDNQSLPFMAMLRNLRNMIIQNISPKHHRKILSKLSNKELVIRSRQLPFRFLSAYKVILELEQSVLQSISSTVMVRKLLKKIPSRCKWNTVKRTVVRRTLAVPMVYRKYQNLRNKRNKARQGNCNAELLAQYKQALETAIQISCRHSIPPLPGRTLIICDIEFPDKLPCKSTKDLCSITHPTSKGHRIKRLELSVLMALMLGYSCEHAQVVLNYYGYYVEAELEPDALLDNSSKVVQQAWELRYNCESAENIHVLFNKLISQRIKVETAVILGHSGISQYATFGLRRYKKELNPDMLLVKVNLNLKDNPEPQYLDKNYVELYGFSEQMLKFVAERGSSRLLDHIEHIDNIYHVPPADGAKEQLGKVTEVCPLPPTLTESTSTHCGEMRLHLCWDPVWFRQRCSALSYLSTASFCGELVIFSQLLQHNRSQRSKVVSFPLSPCISLSPGPAPSVRFSIIPRCCHYMNTAFSLHTLSFLLSPSPSTVCILCTRWRTVRVFISSTFRDMHGERDMLVRSVFPELRRRAAPHCLCVQEVELHWGVSEEESSRHRMVELCLSEVCRSQLFVGILGERYGLVPTERSLPELPQYDWLKRAHPGLSVTELEILQFKEMYPDTANGRMFFFLRSPDMIRSVPVSWRAEFAAESGEAESKMADLKRRVLSSGAKTTKDYPSQWGGVIDGKPCTSGLEVFRKAVLDDIWGALLEQFVQEDEGSEAGSEVTKQEVYQEAQQRQCQGRRKLVATAAGKIRESGKGGPVLVHCGPGEGKTVFMAALANELKCPSGKTPSYDVISYFAEASQSSRRVEQLLRCLAQWLEQRLPRETELPTTYRELLADFHTQLVVLCVARKKQPLAILVDGADCLQDAQGQPVSDWIPQHLPQGVTLVLSVTSNSALQQSLAKRKATVPFPLGQLSLPDRKEIVQKGLAVYGKKLSDSAFNNQLQTLLMKKGSVSPLYLRLACEELRAFAVFEKMKDALQTLPSSLGQLVQHSLSRLKLLYGAELLSGALGALTVSQAGLREQDLYSLLCMCKTLATRSGEEPAWQEVMRAARQPESRIPMATFSELARTMQSMIGQSYIQDPDSRFCLANDDVRSAFEKQFLPSQESRRRAHLLLAAHLWTLADPGGRDRFLHCEAEALRHLPFHLVKGGQLAVLHSLLSSFHFLHAHVRLGLLSHLLDTFSLSDSSMELEDGVAHCKLEVCRDFLHRHAPVLSHWPALFIQQALNEPEGCAAHVWAQGIVGRETDSVRLLRWLNKPHEIQKKATDTVTAFHWMPTCVSVQPKGRLAVVGTGQGSLHIINTETGQEVRSLMSSCDGISGCVFLQEGLLGSTSFDGQIEVWDIDSGCRTVEVDAHKNSITGCDVTTDRKNLATVSLDSKLKVWAVPKGSLAAILNNPCPLNCVTFHPEGHLVVAGGWDKAVRLWNWLTGQSVATLSGHEVSVRSLSFSPSGGLLTSGCLSGDVRLWSAPTWKCVGHYRAHQGATEVLRFMEGGRLLLSGGSDNMVHLWSGSLGLSIGQLGDSMERSAASQGQGSGRSATVESPALCVAVAGDYVAVGYQSNGIHLYHRDSGERRWVSEGPGVSVRCLLWLQTESQAELLVSGSDDHVVRLWCRETEGHMRSLCRLVGHRGPVLALACSPDLLASASEDFTVSLWSVQSLRVEAGQSGDLILTSVLRGHTGGVTCLCFSPNGQELLSGGKDQSLLVWDVRASPPGLSRSFLHCHTDWITGCTWTESTLVSCSIDCLVRVWDPASGQCFREFVGQDSPLSSVCSLGEYVLAGSGSGELAVWQWESGVEVTRIPAHSARIHHCTAYWHSGAKGEIQSQYTKPKDLAVATASDDGTVQLWLPLQVENRGSLSDHRGVIRGSAPEEEVPAFLTVAEDRTMRAWSISTAMENPVSKKGGTTALCFSPCGQLLVSGHGQGQLCVWHQNSVICCMQVSHCLVSSVAFMSEREFAVACLDNTVTTWRLEWTPPQTTAQVKQLSSYTVGSSVLFLHYCSMLLAACPNGSIIDLMDPTDVTLGWFGSGHIHAMQENDCKSLWVVADKDCTLEVGFIFIMGKVPNTFHTLRLEQQESSSTNKSSVTTAVAIHQDLLVCGDSTGKIWYKDPPGEEGWSSKKQAHTDKISVLKATERIIISASHDQSVKLWDRGTRKQVGMFLCQAPVVSLALSPSCPTEMACGDSLGNVYRIAWGE